MVDATVEAWEALGGSPQLLASLSVSGPPRVLAGPLDSSGVAVAAVSAALLAAAELSAARGLEPPVVAVDTQHVAAAFRSERFVRLNGNGLGAPFDPLSTFAATADGWIRMHGNYPHHRDAVRRVLGGDPLEGATGWGSIELEDAIVAEEGAAAAMRTPGEWAAHPQGALADGTPLVAVHADATPSVRRLGSGGLAEGLRVLDLTRVIAGPVAGRTLAALGRTSCESTGRRWPICRCSSTTPAQASGRCFSICAIRPTAIFDRLLAAADVLLMGYRPGALAKLGLSRDELRSEQSDLVVVCLSAWGDQGPWGGRRGFDSLVQSACGIADLTGTDGVQGALPAQVLDHATGHLMAATALRLVAGRERGEGAGSASLALARTAAWLMSRRADADEQVAEADAEQYLVDLPGATTVVSPPGRIGGVPLHWQRGARPLGSDRPEWLA